MKNWIRLGAVALALAAALACTGCAARTPVSSEEFQTHAENAGFIVQAPETGSEDLVDFRIALDQEAGMEIDFAVCKDQQTAVDTYNSIKNNIKMTDLAKTKNVDSSAYSRYTVENGEIYYVVVRLEDTVALGKGKIIHQNKMNTLFDSIKY